jgi:hypothetical protein
MIQVKTSEDRDDVRSYQGAEYAPVCLMWPSGKMMLKVADVLGLKPPPGRLSTAPN